MSELHVFDHPLIQHKLSILRDKNTSVKEFRELVGEIAMLMCYEATRDLPLEEVEIETPVAKATVKRLAGKKLAIVPILRAGLGMVDGMVAMIPSCKVGHIGLYRDPKLRAARQKFGVLGPYVYECLLDIAYGDKGYYIAYSGEGREDTLWQLREYTAGLENVTIETLAAVVDQLVASGLFHAALYERGFLTSKRIQMGYFLATVTRNAVPINFDIWLLTEQEMREKNPSGKSFVLRAFISRTENAIYRTENAIYCTENPQSREEQRTEEQRTVEDSRAEQTREEKAVTADSGLTTELEEKLNCKFDHNFCLELRRLQNKGMQREVFLDTARQTAENAPRNPAGYFRTLLQNCERDGIFTAEDMQKRAKPAPAQPAIGPSSEQLSAFDREWYERVKRYTREKAVPS